MGPPTELYESPKTAFVANFLGQSNLFPAKIIELSGEDLILEDIDGRYIMPMSRVSEHVDTTAGTQVLVGVRPEKIAIGRLSEAGEPPADGNFVDGHVLSMSFLGVSTQYEVRTKGGDMINVFSQNLDVHNVLPPGTEVRLSWLPHHGFVLGGSEDIHAGMDRDD
jgi:spermidine/putrescine transport system ATP-binding protein